MLTSIQKSCVILVFALIFSTVAPAFVIGQDSISITNSVQSSSHTGSQSTAGSPGESGQAGEDGQSGRDGQPGQAGQSGADGSVINGANSAAVDIESVINGDVVESVHIETDTTSTATGSITTVTNPITKTETVRTTETVNESLLSALESLRLMLLNYVALLF